MSIKARVARMEHSTPDVDTNFEAYLETLTDEELECTVDASERYLAANPGSVEAAGNLDDAELI